MLRFSLEQGFQVTMLYSFIKKCIKFSGELRQISIMDRVYI